MILITDPLETRSPDRKLIPLRLDRHKLAKRRFRARAADGTDFGFDLSLPLKHGDAIHETDAHRYEIEQTPEAVLRIPFEDGRAGALYGWMVGNMHFSAAFAVDHILAEDDPAVRQLLDRNHIVYQMAEQVFQPAIAASGHHH